ncbi:Condensin complex subunit 2 [Quillaja saponaria]|uniref:Condensin complex subunit 2 n=1 Tax=Quillaja saponaria TaxID=32244 RepID=A0AAD7KYA0_QUISA|nr:Condensin complex subunit 2 [Quillaja saponaria]
MREQYNDHGSFYSWDGDIHNAMEDSSTLVSRPRQSQEEMASSRQILANFPSDCSAAPTINDSSPICVQMISA